MKNLIRYIKEDLNGTELFIAFKIKKYLVEEKESNSVKIFDEISEVAKYLNFNKKIKEYVFTKSDKDFKLYLSELSHYSDKFNIFKCLTTSDSYSFFRGEDIYEVNKKELKTLFLVELRRVKKIKK